MGHISKEKFEQKKIDRLLNHLRVYHEKGHPIDFEIFVDGFKVVRRTNDIEMFSMYEEFVDADTQTVEFLLYTGNSNNNHKHIFYFGDSPRSEPDEPANKQGLSGIEIDQRIEEGVEKRIKDERYRELEKDNQVLKEEVRDLERDVDRLEREKDELLEKQSPLFRVLGSVGSNLVESFIRRNPKIVSSIPGGEALAGLLEPESANDVQVVNEGHVSFQPKSSTSTVTEEERDAITFVNQLKSQFTREEFDKVAVILQALADDKTKIELIINHVSIKTQ